MLKKNNPGVPQIQTNTIVNSPFEIGGVEFIPIEVMHHKLPVFGFRIGDFSYITDANYISEEEKKKVFGSEVLVLNALQKESHISHYNLEQAIEVAQEINAPKTYFIHMSHRLGRHKDISEELPEGIHLAYDGLTLEL